MEMIQLDLRHTYLALSHNLSLYTVGLCIDTVGFQALYTGFIRYIILWYHSMCAEEWLCLHRGLYSKVVVTSGLTVHRLIGWLSWGQCRNEFIYCVHMLAISVCKRIIFCVNQLIITYVTLSTVSTLCISPLHTNCQSSENYIYSKLLSYYQRFRHIM